MTEPVAYRFETVADFDKNGTMDDLIVSLKRGEAPTLEPVYFTTGTDGAREKITQGADDATVDRLVAFVNDFDVDFSDIGPKMPGFAEQGVDISDDHAYVLGIMGDIYGNGTPEILMILDPEAAAPVVQHVVLKPGVTPETATQDDFITINMPSPSVKNETAPNGDIIRIITLK